MRPGEGDGAAHRFGAAIAVRSRIVDPDQRSGGVRRAPAIDILVAGEMDEHLEGAGRIRRGRGQSPPANCRNRPPCSGPGRRRDDRRAARGESGGGEDREERGRIGRRGDDGGNEDEGERGPGRGDADPHAFVRRRRNRGRCPAEQQPPEIDGESGGADDAGRADDGGDDARRPEAARADAKAIGGGEHRQTLPRPVRPLQARHRSLFLGDDRGVDAVDAVDEGGTVAGEDDAAGDGAE